VPCLGEVAGLPLHRLTPEQAADDHAVLEKGVTGKLLLDVA